MEITHLKDRRLTAVTVIAALLYGTLAVVLRVNVFFAALDSVLFFAAVFLRFRIKDELPWWVKHLIALAGSLICFFFAQLICGAYFNNITFFKFFLNLIVAYSIIMIIAGASRSLKAGVISMLVFSIILAAIDHLVVQARSYEIRFTDLFSMTTAVKVAGDYSFSFGARSAAGLFAVLPILALIIFNKFPRFTTKKARIAGALSGALTLTISVVLVLVPVLSGFIGYQIKFWKYQNSSFNGFYLGLIKSVSSNTIKMPEGYSSDTLRTELDRELGGSPEEFIPGQSDKRPNVIVIMNETFSDLDLVSRMRGYGIETNKDPLEFYHSISGAEPNVIKGNAYASVFGGNTANSEFEFLTGNTMAFIDQMVVPYNNMVNDENALSLVEIFNQYGYETIGMHPENRTNWGRNRIYDFFGFKEQYFLRYDNTFVDQDKLTDEDMYRGHVSDETVYKKIIKLFENKEKDSSLFTFAVTMQNHGGYYSNPFDYEIMSQMNSDTMLDEYLTTVSHSDAALKTLIEYFKDQKEETIILFFGDHQPSLNDGFYEKYMGLTTESQTGEMMSKYLIPYMIWSNRPLSGGGMAEQQPTSINFLANRLLDALSMEKTPFFKLLDKVSEKVKAINAFGWWDEDGEFHETGDLSTIDAVRNYSGMEATEKALNADKKSASLLNLYYWVEYNLLKDDKNKLTDYYVLSKKVYLESRQTAED